jgi:hypothetical protein
MFSVCLIKGLATLAKLAKGILKSKILTAESFFSLYSVWKFG